MQTILDTLVDYCRIGHNTDRQPLFIITYMKKEYLVCEVNCICHKDVEKWNEDCYYQVKEN